MARLGDRDAPSVAMRAAFALRATDEGSSITGSFGVAPGSAEATTVEALLRLADARLCEGKAAQRAIAARPADAEPLRALA